MALGMMVTEKMMTDEERAELLSRIEVLQDKLHGVKICKHCGGKIWKIDGKTWLHKDTDSVWCVIFAAEPAGD